LRDNPLGLVASLAHSGGNITGLSGRQSDLVGKRWSCCVAAGAIDPIDPNKREAANVRACRLAGAISRMSATYQQGLLTLQRKRTGGNQQVTVKHIHQQVNVTQGGQAVVAGDKVTRGPGERRRGTIENEQRTP